MSLRQQVCVITMTKYEPQVVPKTQGNIRSKMIDAIINA